MVALARSWRPTEVLPGARTWVEASQAGQEALRGLQEHLAIEPPPDQNGDGLRPSESPGPAPAGYRLRLAVAAAARDGDQDATAALVRQAPAHGVEVAELVAVAQAHWPKPRLHRRAFRAGRRWAVARLHRPRGRAALAEPERQP
jgi:IS5 family transposase